MILNDETAVKLEAFEVEPFDGEDDPDETAPVPTRESRFDPVTPPVEESAEEGFHQEAPDVEEALGQTDFASIKFQRENTLLTNAERYGESIRDEAELYVRQLQTEIEALNQQAEQRYEEARLVKEAAERDAQERIDAAEARVDEINQQAYKEGFEQGREEGMKRRYEEAAGKLRHMEEILGDLSFFREQVDYYMEKDGIRLAILIAKKIVHQELKVNRKVVWRLLASTLARLEGTGNFRIWLSPEDYEFATAARPTLERFIEDDQTLTFRSRADLPPSNALIETDREVIDLTIATQFQQVEAALYQALAEREAHIVSRTAAPIIGPGARPRAAAPPAADAAAAEGHETDPPPGAGDDPTGAPIGGFAQEGIDLEDGDAAAAPTVTFADEADGEVAEAPAEADEAPRQAPPDPDPNHG